MPEIEIRPVVVADVESLSAFEHGYYSEYVWQMGFDINPDLTRTDFRRTRLPRQVFVPYPKARSEIFEDIPQAEAFLVAVHHGQQVGYIKVQAEKSSKIARVSDLVISADMRRQGIGSGLLFAAMDLVAHRNFYALIMEMQLKNEPAINMAAKLGFKFCGFRDHYFSNNELALFFSRFTH
jgi:ribosomal protein S18 acetylase RimI-like enzyme